MKTTNTYLLPLLGLLFLMSSCGLPGYLPKPDKLSENHYGAFISVQLAEGSGYRGDLLSANDSGLYLLELWANDTVIQVARDRVAEYELVYAEGTDYGWAFLGAVVLSASHDFFWSH